MIIDLDTYIFSFGKYEGDPANIVADINPSYIRWCYNNVEWFELSDEDYTRIIKRIKWLNKKKGGSGLSGAVEYGLEVFGNDIMF